MNSSSMRVLRDGGTLCKVTKGVELESGVTDGEKICQRLRGLSEIK